MSLFKSNVAAVNSAEPGDMNTLGVRTIEGFGVTVDNISHRFIATTTLAALMEIVL